MIPSIYIYRHITDMIGITQLVSWRRRGELRVTSSTTRGNISMGNNLQSKSRPGKICTYKIHQYDKEIISVNENINYTNLKITYF